MTLVNSLCAEISIFDGVGESTGVVVERKLLPDLRLVYLGVGNRVLEWPSSDDDRTTSEVTGEIHHFSRYAVAY